MDKLQLLYAVEYDKFFKDYLLFEIEGRKVTPKNLFVATSVKKLDDVTDYDLAKGVLEQLNSSVAAQESLKNSKTLAHFIKSGFTLEFIPKNENMVVRFNIKGKIIYSLIKTNKFDESVNPAFNELAKSVEAFKGNTGKQLNK